MGYAASKRVKPYGEEYGIVSDPFLEDQDIVDQAKTIRSTDGSAPIHRSPERSRAQIPKRCLVRLFWGSDAGPVAGHPGQVTIGVWMLQLARIR
jgi:hypothetical protein